MGVRGKTYHPETNVAHLDFCGPLTRKKVRAVNQLVSEGILTFITVQQHDRWGHSFEYDPEAPPFTGQLLWSFPYVGNKGRPMVTYALKELTDAKVESRRRSGCH
jgi:hypothetical protein